MSTATVPSPIPHSSRASGPAENPPRPYESYVYAYPHKTAYRPLRPRPALRDLWAGEAKNALSLYLHIPFCEVRCGFCNLFTRIGAPEGLTTAYLDALERQAGAVREALGEGDVRFASAAFGGGTPTFLEADEVERLCDIATRLSIGVQSFVDTEARAAVRPQRRADVEAALGRIREAGIPILNIDLIYGIDGQTERTWQQSLDAALAWAPEELYLYPLYVRPLTGLGRTGTAAADDAASVRAADIAWDEQRLRLYRHGRDHLLAHGYEQVSMRMFRRKDAPATGGEDYACQTDGMVGLGCGARSYTSKLHYSFDYAVDMREIRSILDDYIARPAREFAFAEFGRVMDAQESRRRHLLQSLLQAEGLEPDAYRSRFGTSVAEDFPAELERFAFAGWLDDSAAPHRLRLSAEGLAHSDAVGPALFSASVRAAMAAYTTK
jgi:oxygen-independent coproporphyrinogen-3 oxidase